MVKTYEELELKDDFMFSVIMRDPRYVNRFWKQSLGLRLQKSNIQRCRKTLT